MCDIKESKAYLEVSLCQVLRKMCLYNTGGLRGLSIKKGPFSPNFFQWCFQNGFEGLKFWHSYHFSCCAHLSFPRFHHLGIFWNSAEFLIFFLISKGILFQASAVKRELNCDSSEQDCDIRVSNGNPTFYPDAQIPLDSRFKNNTYFVN